MSDRPWNAEGLRDEVKVAGLRQDRAAMAATAAGPGVSLGLPAAGGGIGNTPPPSSNWVAAEDWFEWNLYINWRREKWAKLRDRLEGCKQSAGLRNAEPETTGWEECGARLEVDAIGGRLGKPRKGPFCKFRVNFADYMSILLMDREKAHKTLPNASLFVSGEGCLMAPARSWWDTGGELMDSLGGTIAADKLSRVDICLDMPGVDIGEFLLAYREGRYVCRANTRTLKEGNGVTIYFGEGQTQVRIYDKLREVKQKASPLRFLAMKEYRWGGEVPDTATRVEFQLRREALKGFGVNGVQDYYERRGSIVRYLTEDWLRLTVDPVQRTSKNQARARVLPLWTDVAGALSLWASGADHELSPLPKEKVDVSQLLKQAKGVLLAAMKACGLEDLSESEFLRIAVAWLQGV